MSRPSGVHRFGRRRAGIHPVTLHFDDRRWEQSFQADDDAATVPRIGTATAVLMASIIPFGLLDHAMDPVNWGRVAALRLTAVGLLVVYLVLRARPGLRRYTQALMVAFFVYYCWALDLMPLVSDVPRDYARFGTLLMVLGSVGVVRIRFLTACVITLIALPSAQLIVILRRDDWRDAVFETFVFVTFALINLTGAYTLERSKRLEFTAQRALADARQLSDALLHNILPEKIAAQLRGQATYIADSVTEASVLFADIVGFTPFASSLPPDELVRLLDTLFGRFDDLCETHGIEKIKTVGDAYMAVAGIPEPDPDHAASVAELALDMQRSAAAIAPLWPNALSLRIGISSGPVVAGVIGHKKFAYDLWGDTVNTASRMESHGLPHHIQVSESTHRLLRDRYAFSEPQAIDVKGKGILTTYFLEEAG